jgi:hypothetical protein
MPNSHDLAEGQPASAGTTTTSRRTTGQVLLDATTFARLGGGPGSPTRRIGTVTLKVSMTFRQSYETACNYHDVEVPAGTEVELTSNGYYVSARLPGTITASLYVNRVLSATSQDVDELKGQDATYVFETYDYAAVKAIIDGTFLEGAVVRLDEDVRFDVRQFDDGEHGGLKFQYGISVATD